MVIKRSQIEEWNIERLSAYEHNAKLHPDSHVDQIANSIEEFTFLDPVAVDEKGELLEGHGRLLAAKKRGDKTIPVIQVTGLTEAQKVAYRLTHNKLTMNTGFDPEMLKIDFEFLQDEGFDLDLTGFDELELSNFEDENTINNYDWDSLEDAERPEDNTDDKLIRVSFAVSPDNKDRLFSKLELVGKPTPELIGEALMRLC